MTDKIDLNKYSEFVGAITSAASNDPSVLVERIKQLDAENPDINVATLLTGAMGMSGESGEFSEIVKKVVFHGKPITPELRTHLKKELGDVIWYWTNTCRALGVDPNSVISDNVDKLKARYPGGEFSVLSANNRADSDV